MSKKTAFRKAVISSFGDSSVVSVVESTIPPPPRGSVQVRIAYAGFSGADVGMRLGRYPLQHDAPLTPGYNFVGYVSTNGPGCSKFAPGTAVTAVTVYGSDATQLNLPEKYLVAVPLALAGSDAGLQQVAAYGLDWCTAYGMVVRAAGVRAGQRVFVHGVSGAVGYATMVLCQLRGATVYGTASSRNHEALRAEGAIPFVYTDKRWMEAMLAVGGAHAVFDPLGFESFDESYSILSEADGGVLVGYGGNKGIFEGDRKRSVYPWIAKLMAQNLKVCSKKKTVFYYITRDGKDYEPDFKAVMELGAEGKIRAPIKEIYELTTESLRKAHDSWGRSPGMGSLVVRVTRATS